MNISEEHIEVFMSLFKGKEDIYVRKWEKYHKSGYMPAYELD